MSGLSDALKDYVFKVGGKLFRCECGANVFRKISDERCQCNGCGEIYVMVPKDEPEREAVQ